MAPDDVLTDDEIRAVLQAATGYEPRLCDVAIIRTMGGTADATADLIWDHWFGEPRTPSRAKVLRAVRGVVTERRRRAE